MADKTDKIQLGTSMKEYPLYKISECGDAEKVVDIEQFKTCELVEELKRRKDVCKSLFVETGFCYYVEIASPIGELIQHEEDSGAAQILILNTDSGKYRIGR
jgi:hypothetical protein